MRAGFAICDAIGGMTAAFAVSSALYQRTHTGRGQLVDVAMLDAALAFLSSFVDRLHGGRPRAGPVRQPGAEPAADGGRVQGARAATSCSPSTTRSSSGRCRARSACRTSPRTRASATGRRASPTMPRCAPSSRRSFAADDDKTWEARLTKADVPCSRVWTHRRDRRPSAARPPRRAAARGDALRPDDAGRLGLPAGARRRQRRAAAGAAGRACRGGAGARRATARARSRRCAATA